VDQPDGIVGEQHVVASGQLQVVTQIAAGICVGHGRHGVSESDALVERCEHAEFHPSPQGGLADEQARERARRVEVMICQEPQRLQLVIVGACQELGVTGCVGLGIAAGDLRLCRRGQCCERLGLNGYI